MRIDIKPLSVNKTWRGRRFKTDDYKRYERAVLFMLRPVKIYDKMEVDITYGFSSKLADVDNPCKPLLDILCKKYNFDDRQIFKLTQEKVLVKKGMEFIEFEIKEYERERKEFS